MYSSLNYEAVRAAPSADPEGGGRGSGLPLENHKLNMSRQNIQLCVICAFRVTCNKCEFSVYTVMHVRLRGSKSLLTLRQIINRS